MEQEQNTGSYILSEALPIESKHEELKTWIDSEKERGSENMRREN